MPEPFPPGTLQEIDDRQWREAWDLKVFGYISLTRSLYANLKGRQGVIVNIIGAGGETFRPDYIASTRATRHSWRSPAPWESQLPGTRCVWSALIPGRFPHPGMK